MPAGSDTNCLPSSIRSKLDWLRKYSAFTEGIPRHDTIRRVMSSLNTQETEAAFQSWVSEMLKKTGHNIIAMDGKAARGSFKTKGQPNALHTVSAWCTQNQLVLGQVAVDEKSNEITAIPALLRLNKPLSP